MSAYVSIRQHTSAYVSLGRTFFVFESIWIAARNAVACAKKKKHTSAYVSIRQQTDLDRGTQRPGLRAK
jgi:hypothetical protein